MAHYDENSTTLELVAHPETHAQLRQAFATLRVPTNGQALTELTYAINHWLAEINVDDGEVTVFCQHTSASLTLQENADPNVHFDLLTSLDRLAPETELYRHSSEGPDDMPAHIKGMLTGVSHQVPVLAGRMALGTWQGVFLAEHRHAPHIRAVILRYLGT